MIELPAKPTLAFKCRDSGLHAVSLRQVPKSMFNIPKKLMPPSHAFALFAAFALDLERRKARACGWASFPCVK